MPALFELYKTGPLDENFIAAAIINKIGLKKTKAPEATQTSNTLFPVGIL